MADPVTIALVFTALAGAGSAYQQKQSGKFQEQALKVQAREEEIAARERELMRKQKINDVLAAQITGLGASGIQAAGSPQLVAIESLEQETLGGLADAATRSGRQRALRNQGAAARQLGNIGAAVSLLQTGANAASLNAQL